VNFSFEHPWFLLLLVSLPAVLLVLRFSLADSPRAQLALSAATRCVILLLLALALASTLRVTKSNKVSLLVLGDVSDSVPESAVQQASNLWAKVSTNLPSSAKVGLATFAGTNEPLVSLSGNPDLVRPLQRPRPAGETAMERALSTAWQTMPSDSLNRILVLSDGNETVGDGIAAAKRAAVHGLRVYTASYETDPKDEVLLEDLVVPGEVKKGQSFAVTAVAQATRETKATFTLYRDGFKIQDKELNLKVGPNTLAFQETKAKEGLVKYELRVKAEHDFFADNNVASGLVSVSGEPKILLLEGTERDARFLARALEAEHIQVDVREGKGIPGSLDELAAYDAVIFSDVPATDVNVRQMSLLRSYVEDLGGGFVMLGGQESFGLGGYYRTAIEDALPVRMRSEKKKDTPGLAMMIVIDRSGSMGGEKLDLAKEAAISAVELMTDRDYVGVVAFDTEVFVIAELQGAGNKSGIIQSIERIDAGGGTSMYPPMVRAHEMLQGITAGLKHCIVLTDGVSSPGDFQGITATMTAEQITVSTVAVGTDIDAELLQSIARWGRGRFYQSSDPHDIPQIFAKETMTASKSSLIEEPFLPQVLHEDQVVRGIDWKNAPFLFGYVVVSPKPTASVSLLTERGDPLYAGWRFGLGKTAAFMSDAKSKWAADWVRWPGYGQFWAQVVRDVMRTTQHRGVETRISMKGDQGRIVIDTIDEAGNFVNGLTTKAQLIKPDLSLTSLELRQSAPGRYESAFPMTDMGSYLLKIRQTKPKDGGGEDVLNDYTRAVTVSYKPEYRHLALNEPYLRELASATGGKFQPTRDDLFKVDPGESVPIRQRLWPWLLLAALLLFVVDVALRRLDLAGRGLFNDEAKRYG
jgi:Ca-activated chloride channel homolog